MQTHSPRSSASTACCSDCCASAVPRLTGIWSAPSQHAADEEDPEQAVLGQEARDPPGVPDEPGEDQRVGVRDVVGGDQHPAGRRDVLPPPPAELEEHRDQRVDHHHREAEPEAHASPPRPQHLGPPPSDPSPTGEPQSVRPPPSVSTSARGGPTLGGRAVVRGGAGQAAGRGEVPAVRGRSPAAGACRAGARARAGHRRRGGGQPRGGPGRGGDGRPRGGRRGPRGRGRRRGGRAGRRAEPGARARGRPGRRARPGRRGGAAVRGPAGAAPGRAGGGAERRRSP